ncbi:MAG: hypothetical protein V3S16_13480 [Candidatus Desulfatibia sp.]|uniref:PIN domain-containing protein n=1 Tax=Candidatus Desulfatibia sp. TaxID=3101189 RepID=UPI002F2E6805
MPAPPLPLNCPGTPRILYNANPENIPVPEKTEARRILKNYFQWEFVINDAGTILQASEIEENYSISFWDALIVSAAFSKNAATILTEDLQHGQRVGGILIHNPFLRELPEH